MLTNSPTQLSLTQLFDALLDGVLYYRAVRDGMDQTITDFVIDYANPAVQATVQSQYQITIGTSVRHDNRHDSATAEQMFALLKAVVETGQPGQFDYYSQVLNEWLSVSRTKAGDGVLSISHIITASKQAALNSERQQVLLNGVLNTSLNTTFVYEALRDETGHIQDFKVLLVNERARREVVAKLGIDPVGKTLLTINPSSRLSGQFNLFCQVIESGESIQTEQFYPDAQQVWYNTNITKLNDGVVVTGIDITTQKRNALQVEDRAKENERQANFLNNVLDASPNGIVAERAVRDAEGTIVDFIIISANQQAAEIVHSTVEALVGQSDLELHPELRSSGLFDAYVKTVETGQPQHVETHYNDGRLNEWINVSARKLAGEELVITFSNVSDVKQARQALEQAAFDNKAQAELMQTMLDGAINGVLLLEPIHNGQGTVVDFRIRAANQAVKALTGANPETAVGQTMRTIYPGYEKGGFFALYCDVLRSGQSQRKEYYYEDRSLKAWFEVSVVKQGDGIVLTFNNTTEARQAQVAAEQARADLQSVIDYSQTGIFVFSPVRDESGEVVDFRFKTINRMVAALIGQTPEAIAGDLASNWFISYRETNTFERYKLTLSTGEEQRFDSNYKVDGLDVWFDVHSVRLGDDVLVTFSDYTPLKKLQQQLEASVADLRRSNANLEQFAYVASHDLQEPLRKIQAFGDIIETQYGVAVGEQGVDMIRRMQSAASRMQVLIRDVLAYSRIATRPDAIGPVDLSQVVARVVDDLETAIADREAILTVDPLPTLTGDTGQLRQLFQNLLSNALKFVTPRPAPGKTGEPAYRNARIQVTTRTIKGRDADLTISPADDDRLFHLIEIADNGIGFEPHQAERIFQVFQRLHNRSEYQGTGIGLAIVKKVVENHSGYIQAVGQPGAGATFRILLPA